MKTTTTTIEIEKDAKNRAYAFIIAMGLLNEFQTFCDVTHDIDLHELYQFLLMNTK